MENKSNELFNINNFNEERLKLLMHTISRIDLITFGNAMKEYLTLMRLNQSRRRLKVYLSK